MKQPTTESKGPYLFQTAYTANGAWIYVKDSGGGNGAHLVVANTVTDLAEDPLYRLGIVLRKGSTRKQLQKALDEIQDLVKHVPDVDLIPSHRKVKIKKVVKKSVTTKPKKRKLGLVRR